MNLKRDFGQLNMALLQYDNFQSYPILIQHKIIATVPPV